MLKLLLLLFITLTFVHGHNNKRINDADMQSELMPQELNPFFVPAEMVGRPTHPALPSPLRLRRNSDILTIAETTTMQQVKTYSRIIAGVVLAFSAIVELVVYVMDTYA